MKQKTLIIFSSVTVLALASMALILFYGKPWLPLIIFSVLAGAFTIYKSEKEGFVRSKEIRRSYEPPRHYNSAQVLSLVVLIMAEIGVCAYALLT